MVLGLFLLAATFCLHLPTAIDDPTVHRDAARGSVQSDFQVRPYAGMVINLSTQIKPGTYHLGASPAGDETDPAVVKKESPVILIQGNGITANFNKVVLAGSSASTPPDQRHGIAVIIKGNNNTIIGLRAKGYKIGILAEGCKNLHLIHCDLSDNWKQHLLSTPQKEDLNDWQSYHHNEHHEWLRYGAGIYLDGCSHFSVQECTVKRGQCGLMINKGTYGEVLNNNFSFNSGLGIGLYRSSYNRITNNKVDWDVRGYSWNNYYRGQDSASILVFEQCMDNLVAYNSMAQGGDGLFLFAGFHTLDTGDGGCNGNVFAFNDVSSAITNGLEATFSQNSFIGNLALQCWHGMWGGYSYDSRISGNIFGFSSTGIAIEHGSNNSIDQNTFIGCRKAIHLWAFPPTGMPAPYLQAHPSLSENPQIDGNQFDNCTAQPITLQNTSNTEASQNTIHSLTGSIDHWILAGPKSQPIKQSNNRFIHSNLAPQTPALKAFLAGSTEYEGNMAAEVNSLNWDPIKHPIPNLAIADPTRPGHNVLPPKNGIDPYLGGYSYRGRRYVMIGPWGPYDFTRPKFLYLGEDEKSRTFRFQTLGPKGRFVLKSVSGGNVVSAVYGDIGNVVSIKATPSAFNSIQIHAVFTGSASRDSFGNRIPKNTPVSFAANLETSNIPWTAYYYLYGPDTDPLVHPRNFSQLLRSNPVAKQNLTKISFINHSDWAPGVRADHYVIVAVSKINLPSGTYHVELTVDDGGKLIVDNQPVPLYDDQGKIANPFRYQGATTYHANIRLSRGLHEFKIVYFQIDGGRTLQFQISPPSGSPH